MKYNVLPPIFYWNYYKNIYKNVHTGSVSRQLQEIWKLVSVNYNEKKMDNDGALEILIIIHVVCQKSKNMEEQVRVR
jgi:hypothetical protein